MEGEERQDGRERGGDVVYRESQEDGRKMTRGREEEEGKKRKTEE